MPTIVLDGTGKTKAALVERIYEYCALSGAEFERTAEEMTAGLRDLNDTAAELLANGIDLGYDFPTYGEGLPEEPSGISDADVSALTLLAAQARIAGLGGVLSPDLKARLNRSYMSLQSRYASMPVVTPARMPRGAGRGHGVRYDFRTVDTTIDPGDLASIVGDGSSGGSSSSGSDYDPGDLASLID